MEPDSIHPMRLSTSSPPRSFQSKVSPLPVPRAWGDGEHGRRGVAPGGGRAEAIGKEGSFVMAMADWGVGAIHVC